MHVDTLTHAQHKEEDRPYKINTVYEDSKADHAVTNKTYYNITMPVPYHTYDEHTIDDLKAFKCAFPKYSTCIRTVVVSLKLAKERTWQSKERNVRQQC